MFSRQLLYYSHTTSTVVRDATVLSCTTNKINCIIFDIGETQFTWDTTNIKIKNKHPKNYVLLVYDEKVPRHFWKITIVTRVLLSRNSEIKGAIVRVKKINGILKHPVNKLFPIEYIYHDTNQTDKAREQELRWEAAIIGELKRKYEC